MRVLLFELRSEGHHLPWTGMIVDALLAHGAEVVLGHGDDKRQLERLNEGFPGILDRITCRVAQRDGRFDAGSVLQSLASCFDAVKPDRLLAANLDEFASSLFRKVALGGGLPKSLVGQLRGIYHRPRPLDSSLRGLGHAWKRRGFLRLQRGGGIARLGLLDEFMVESMRRDADSVPVTWMPNCLQPLEKIDSEVAREVMGVPNGRMALLCFGVPHRRKGIHLALEAMEQLRDSPAFLLVAGRQVDDPVVRSKLGELIEQGRAVVHDRFLSEREVAHSFAACDRVLMPYISHYGSSDVLCAAATSGRSVIASEHALIGRLVSEHRLGVVHRNGDAESLAKMIEASIQAPDREIADWDVGLAAWASRNTPDEFARAVWELVEN